MNKFFFFLLCEEAVKYMKLEEFILPETIVTLCYNIKQHHYDFIVLTDNYC
jgi:hypothetical protein